MHTKHWLVVGAALLGACGAAKTQSQPASNAAMVPDDEPLGPVFKHGDDKIIITVGSDGGKLELKNGARLEIPDGALKEPVEITLAEGGHTTAFANHEYERAIGPTIEIAPAVVPAVPFVVSIPLEALPEGFTEEDLAMATEVVSDDQRALDVEMTGVQTRWYYMPARSRKGRVVGELAQVPGMRVQFVVSRGNN
jgi:hypothetical protein